MFRSHIAGKVLVSLAFALLSGRTLRAQTCNCSCDASIPPTLDVLKVYRNEGPLGPTAYVTAGRGSSPCHNTEIAHANEFNFGGGMVITHLCLNMKYPDGQPGNVAYAFIASQDPNNQNLPGNVEHETPFTINVNGGHQIVQLRSPVSVMGVKWVGVRYPTARCFITHQGVGPRNPAGLRAAVYIKGGGGWRDYENTHSGAYTGKAPLIRPLWLVPAGTTGVCNLILSFQANANGLLETTEPGGRTTVSATLSKVPSAPVTVSISSTDLTEGDASVHMLTFTPANWNLPQTFDVVGIDDSLFDGPVNYRINFHMTSADPCYNNRPVPGLNCVNLDDEGTSTACSGSFLQPPITPALQSSFEDPAMAFDSWRGVSVLFGGYSGSMGPGETWEWDGSQWSMVSMSGPSSRHGHAMAFDSFRNVVVLMGGVDASGVALSDTWEWDGFQWTQRSAGAPNSPGPRVDHAMAFDAARGLTVLYGGDQPATSSQTWEWDGTTWVARNTATAPTPRSMHAMTFDTWRQRVLLIGGQTNAPPFTDSDVWEYDGSNWSNVAVSGSKPPARFNAGWVHDPVRGISILFGGEAGSRLNDIWEWDGVAKTWTQVSPTSAQPSARTRPAMAFDIPRGVAVIYGGSDTPGSWLQDTWIYNANGPTGTPVTRFFVLRGTGSGTPFSWSLSSSLVSSMTLVSPSFAPGMTPAGMVLNLAAWMNGAGCGQISASPSPIAPAVLTLTTMSTLPSRLTVGAAWLSPGCFASPGFLCAFNPTIEELILDGDDCNGNGIDDVLDIVNDPSLDANGNWQIDACEGVMLGDMNCDGLVNPLDIPDFVMALIDASAYMATHLACPITHGDINGDGQVNGQDIQGFLQLILANQ